MDLSTLIKAVKAIESEVWSLVRKAGYIDERDPLYSKRNRNHILKSLTPVDNWAFYDVPEEIHSRISEHLEEKNKLIRYLNDFFSDSIPDEFLLKPRPEKRSWHAD